MQVHIFCIILSMKLTFLNFRITVCVLMRTWNLESTEPNPKILALSFINGKTLANAGQIHKGLNV